jgi:hypothetical protein
MAPGLNIGGIRKRNASRQYRDPITTGQALVPDFLFEVRYEWPYDRANASIHAALGNLWRRFGLPRMVVKTGGRPVKHARYYWLLLAEGHLTRRRFEAMLGRIALLPVPNGSR